MSNISQEFQDLLSNKIDWKNYARIKIKKFRWYVAREIILTIFILLMGFYSLYFFFLILPFSVYALVFDICQLYYYHRTLVEPDYEECWFSKKLYGGL